MPNAVHLMQNSPESEVGIMPAALLIKDWYRRCFWANGISITGALLLMNTFLIIS